MDLKNRLKETNEVMEQLISDIYDLCVRHAKEVEWWRAYGEYVSKVNRNVDAEACGYADGDEEYEENFEN